MSIIEFRNFIIDFKLSFGIDKNSDAQINGRQKNLKNYLRSPIRIAAAKSPTNPASPNP